MPDSMLQLAEGCGDGMSLVVSESAEQDFLDDILAHSVELRLYSNNITPAKSDTAATFIEVSGGGYVPKLLTQPNWTISPGTPSQGVAPEQVFTFTGPVLGGLVFGYYFVRVSNGRLRWAERFTDGPYSVTFDGDVVRVTPRLNLQ